MSRVGSGRAAREEALRALMASERRGVLAAAIRGLLRVASWLFGVAVWCRTRLYDAGWRRATRVGVPVVSIGNLTAGGTGKTPLTIRVATLAMQRGRRVAVLSRGWGGEGEGPIRNDEGRLLERHLEGAHVRQGPDRVALAREAIERHGSDFIVLDDGFQHRRMARDLDIVTIDATCPFGYGHLLPRGLLRELPGALRRASVIVVTRRDQVAPTRLDEIMRRLRAWAPQVPLITSYHRAAALTDLQGGAGPPLETLRGRPVLLLSAIGNPGAFERTVEDLGARVRDHLRLPDHHRYGGDEIARIDRWAAARGSADDAWLLTTEKDAVKLAREGTDPLARWRPWALGIELVLDEPLAILDELLSHPTGGGPGE